MWLFPFYRWKSSGKRTKWHAGGQHKMSLLRGGDEIWGPRAILAGPLFSPAGCQMPGEIFPEIWLVYTFCMVLNCPSIVSLKRELNCYFHSSSFFAWLAFVTALKPEEVLGTGSLFSIHILQRWKQAGLCCSCTEDIHLVSVQGAPAPFSARGAVGVEIKAPRLLLEALTWQI